MFLKKILPAPAVCYVAACKGKAAGRALQARGLPQDLQISCKGQVARKVDLQLFFQHLDS